ncbi:WD40 repeat-like protein [Dentipellis sp. KUC8613]|nr:WD40 repeat-like protein [Dentipellis sp. KUC8613]
MPKTAYELEREANIARNRALLEQLELKEAVAALGMPSKTKPQKNKNTAKPVQPAKRVKREVVDLPRRQSARLKRTAVDPNETPYKKRKREQEEEALRRKQEQEQLEEEERLREAKKPRHQDLDLMALTDDHLTSGIREVFEALTHEAHPRRVARSDAFVFDNENKEDAEVTALRERLQNLKVVARAKVTENRVYCAAYHPEKTKDLIFFGDKHGQLGIWDARAPPDETEDDEDEDPATKEGGKYWRLQMHWPATSKSSLSCIKFDPTDAHSLYTSSYDCTIRTLSLGSGMSREVFSTDDILISSIDLTPSGNEMWISDASGGVTHLDLRQDKSKARSYQLSADKIGSISVNQVNPSFLLTASNSRVLKIWDVRKLSGMKAKDGALDFDLEAVENLVTSPAGKSCVRAEWPHGKSVSSAYWDPRGRSVVSTSYDDTIRLWDVSPKSLARDAPFANFKPFSRIRHNCQTGKWLTILRAQWSSNPDVYPHFTIGDMDHSLDIFTCKGDLLVKLADKSRITAAQAVTCSHPSVVERAASGNASGRCVLWAPADEEEEEAE